MVGGGGGGGGDGEAAKELHEAVMALPDLNRRTLRLVIRHLVRVMESKQLNRMDSENLGNSWRQQKRGNTNFEKKT